jgi:hypothetical protein
MAVTVVRGTNDVAAAMNVVDGRIEVSEPESGRSRRTLPAPPVMVSLLEAGVHIKAVADLLGHSSIAITGDIYGHASDAATCSAADGLSEVFGLWNSRVPSNSERRLNVAMPTMQTFSDSTGNKRSSDSLPRYGAHPLARPIGSLRYMMGRNELPDLLRFVWRRLPQDQLVKAVSDAWVMCEFPEQRLPRGEWLPIFRAAGYHDELEPATPPDSITLWRGGVRRTRMASTADRERAEWFQHRPGFEGMPGGKRGKLWTVTVGRDRLLAHYHE